MIKNHYFVQKRDGTTFASLINPADIRFICLWWMSYHYSRNVFICLLIVSFVVGLSYSAYSVSDYRCWCGRITALGTSLLVFLFWPIIFVYIGTIGKINRGEIPYMPGKSPPRKIVEETKKGGDKQLVKT